MKTKEEILKAETAHEVLEWMKATPPPHPPEVAEYWNRLLAKEFEERIGSDFDPEMHYDFLKRNFTCATPETGEHISTKEEILKAEKSSDVWRWIVAAPSPLDSDPDVLKYFEELREKELRDYIGPDYDPETHYDIPKRKRGANDVQNHP